MTESKPQYQGYTEPDSVDWEILGILQNDATTPNKEIAALVRIAPSTCLERIRRLRASGVIEAIRAVINPARIGRPTQAFLGIQLRPHSRDLVEDFIAQVRKFPETIAIYNVSGAQDYLLHVATRDTTDLQSLIIDRLATLPQVAHCHTQLIFGSPVLAPIRPAGRDSG